MIGPDGRIDIHRAVQHLAADRAGVITIEDRGEAVLILADPARITPAGMRSTLPVPRPAARKPTRGDRKRRQYHRARDTSGRQRRGRP